MMICDESSFLSSFRFPLNNFSLLSVLCDDPSWNDYLFLPPNVNIFLRQVFFLLKLNIIRVHAPAISLSLNAPECSFKGASVKCFHLIVTN